MLDEQVGLGSGSMVVAGAVGVGKSRLLAHWLADREAQDRPTVVVRATKSTATIPFGAFAPWVPELGDRRDRLGVLQATAARLAELGDGLVVAVDDAQLLDEGSAALVLHLAEHTPRAVVITVRSDAGSCPDAIVALWKERLALRLDLQPLSEPETAELLEQALGDSVAPAARRRLWQLSQGNPLYLREIVEAGGARAGRTRLVELVSDRIGASGSAERRLLEMVALGEPLPTAMVARLAPHELLVRLESQGLLATEQQSQRDRGPEVRLAHPLYSEVLRAELPAFTAQSHNQALAEAALAIGAGRRDPLRVATWLLDSGRDPTEPDLLLQASYMALIIDDYALSARLAEAAERAGGGWRATVRRAEALGPLQRWDEVDALLASLADLPGAENDPRAQAEVARVRAELSFWRRGEDLASARVTVAHAAEVVPAPARSPLLNQGAWLAILALDLDEAIRLGTAAASDAGTVAERLNAIACAGFAAVLQGRTRDALALVDLATPYAFEVIETDPAPGGFLAHTYSYASVLDGRIDEAAAIYEFLLDHQVVRMGGPARGLPSFWLGRAAQAQGRVRTAQRHCQDALDVLGHANNAETGTWVAATLATAAAQSGDTDTAARAVAWIEAHRRVPTAPDALLTDLARAWLAASRGEISTAQDLCRHAADRAGAAGAGMIELLALLDLARLGAPRAAAGRLEQLTEAVEGPYAATAARFAQALATGDGAGLDDTAQRFATMGARLLAAEAAAAAASAYMAAGRHRSRTASLAHARRLAAQCEDAVTPLLARLDHQPVATALTDREREVTGLAARGRTSREIATTLTISVRTVDSHLNHAYTKLGIKDRAELAAALGGDPLRRGDRT